jgi:hypothetical protein
MNPAQWDALGRWQTAIDRALQQAKDEGKFSDLPGEGKPLKLEDDSHTPEHLRLAHKLLKDHGFAPDWIIEGQELDARRDALLAGMHQAAQAYRGVIQDTARAAEGGEARRARAQSAWRLAQDTFNEAARKLNKQIVTYNLKVPPGITHKPLVQIDQEIERLLG